MKAKSQKLKKLKTKQVYGFKKDNFSNALSNFETTTLTTSGIIANI